MKKFFSGALIVVIALLVGGALSYVRAGYVEPAGSPTGNNTPSPILITDQTGDYRQFRKLGKIGFTESVNKSIDTTELANQATVVMGQVSSNGLFAAYTSRIRANLETTSALFPLFVGDPTDPSLQQYKTVSVAGHTRAPRIVAGSRSAPADLFNLFVQESSGATNLGRGTKYFYQGSGSNYGTNCPSGVCSYDTRNQNHFCTLTSNELKSTGCPAQTYLQQVIPGGYGTQVVGVCRYLVNDGNDDFPYSEYNQGSCY